MLCLEASPTGNFDVHVNELISDNGVLASQLVVEADSKFGPICRMLSRHVNLQKLGGQKMKVVNAIEVVEKFAGMRSMIWPITNSISSRMGHVFGSSG